MPLDVLSHRPNGLAQAIADNYDAVVYSQNCLKLRHSLAMIMTQHGKQEHPRQNFKRLQVASMKEETLESIPIEFYKGPKNPAIPKAASKYKVLPLNVLARRHISVRLSLEKDSSFLQDVVKKTVPEYSGHNTINSRKHDCKKTATTILYTPLIHRKPADPTTMLSSMVQAQLLTSKTERGNTFYRRSAALQNSCGYYLGFSSYIFKIRATIGRHALDYEFC